MAAHGHIYWWRLVYCQSGGSWEKINALVLFINTGSHSRLNWINVATRNHINLNEIQFKALKGARWWQLTNQDPKNTLYEISVAIMKFDLPYLSSLFNVVEEENIKISKINRVRQEHRNKPEPGTWMMPVDSGLWFYILMKTMSSFTRSQIGMRFENCDFLDMLKIAIRNRTFV